MYMFNDEGISMNMYIYERLIDVHVHYWTVHAQASLINTFIETSSFIYI